MVLVYLNIFQTFKREKLFSNELLGRSLKYKADESSIFFFLLHMCFMNSYL